ncbi:hypothetical protein NJH49_17840 [Stenotrophomonas maltophilia]|uniref:hypothetical protein n=1 Tax=Stenotrophomonas maltophilia TaxID=40324 RepID=UPI002097D3BC|nr:hypothetical protein [Stenotrophomonas maltophilia]MCO7400686.1 hypothetical protein [Stenotrophomonas maltophilia]MCO7413253.1 hypothetical protein [Stenotrophomonas maltophilia]
MAPPSNVALPEPALRPVIVLETQIPGFGLRASFDQHKILFLALVHIESDTAATFTAHHPRNVMRTASGGIQIGTVVYLLAKGEAERFFQWLRTGESYPGGVN